MNITIEMGTDNRSKHFMGFSGEEVDFTTQDGGAVVLTWYQEMSRDPDDQSVHITVTEALKYPQGGDTGTPVTDLPSLAAMLGDTVPELANRLDEYATDMSVAAHERYLESR